MSLYGDPPTYSTSWTEMADEDADTSIDRGQYQLKISDIRSRSTLEVLWDISFTLWMIIFGVLQDTCQSLFGFVARFSFPLEFLFSPFSFSLLDKLLLFKMVPLIKGLHLDFDPSPARLSEGLCNAS